MTHSVEDVGLDEPLSEDPKIVAMRADGWVDYGGQAYSAFCHNCNNAAGLLVRGSDMICKGCIVWGHASFAEEDPGEIYHDADYTGPEDGRRHWKVWWLSQADLEGMSNWFLPEYILAEVRSMTGRPLRGRLWVSAELDGVVEVEAKRFDQTPLGQSLEKCGGIVVRDGDAQVLRTYPGVVTDLELVRA